jgi:hypothetical protein
MTQIVYVMHQKGEIKYLVFFLISVPEPGKVRRGVFTPTHPQPLVLDIEEFLNFFSHKHVALIKVFSVKNAKLRPRNQISGYTTLLD